MSKISAYGIAALGALACVAARGDAVWETGQYTPTNWTASADNVLLGEPVTANIEYYREEVLPET